MNIHHLENAVDETIYERGLAYFQAGKVIQSSNPNENMYVFQVKGTTRYEVVVEITDQGDVTFSACDCPYSFGPVCKHEVAACMYVAELVQGNDEKVSTTPSPSTSLDEILQSLTKDELINIIIDIAQEDDLFEDRLLATYALVNDEQQLGKYHELIDSIIDRYSEQNGFVHYGASFPLSQELGKVLASANDVEDILVATDIALSVLHATVDTISFADDSAGVIGDVARDAVNTLHHIAMKSVRTADKRNAIFEKVLTESDKEVYKDWTDFHVDLLSVGTIFAGDESLRNKLVEKIERALEQAADSTYWEEKLYQLLLEMKEEYGTPEEARKFLKEHVHLTSFREQLLEKLLQEKNYEKVVSLAKEGEQKDEQHPGLVKIWENYRYQAVKGLSLKEEQKALAMELFLNGDFDYYEELKELAENKQAMYEQLMEQLKTASEWHTNRLLLQVIEAENDLEELLEFVKGNPFYIREYAEKLIELDREAVIDMYEASIKLEAEQTSNRKEYRRLCQEIKKYADIAGTEHKERLIEKLKEQYKRRPAFVDELGKI